MSRSSHFLSLLLLSAVLASAGEADRFAPWQAAADRFLAQHWRTSHYSGIGAKARVMLEMPGPEACFEGVLEALPPAEFWPELPAITRARLQKALPKTSAEALAWTDQRLLHVWALRLNLPGTEPEILAMLDDLRTVRWLVDRQVLESSPDIRLDYAYAERLGAFDRMLRPLVKPPEPRLQSGEAFRQAIREARKTPQERVLGALGQPTYERLQALAKDRVQAQRAGRQIDPAGQAWLDFGPLPAGAEDVFLNGAAGAALVQDVPVPDLVRDLGEREAMALLKEAIEVGMPLDWAEVGPTAILAARGLTDGRLTATQEWSLSFLDQVLATWETPAAPRAEAAMAFMDALEARLAKLGASAEEVIDLTEAHKQKRVLCLLVCGRGAEAAAVLGTTGLLSWSIPPAIEAEQPRAVVEFLLRHLPQHPDWATGWDLMQANAHRAHLETEVLTVLLEHRKTIVGDAEMLITKARLAAGQFEEAAATLRDIVQRPFFTAGYAPTEHQTEAIRLLLQLGDEQQRPPWCDLALNRLQALMKHWLVANKGSSDGGEPWAKWPGLLAGRGRLDLALSAAQLNVRWRQHAVSIGEVFLMSQDKRQEYVLTGPASAMAGLLQVLDLQKKPKAILAYLKTEPQWPTRDLSGVASFADPSFPEPQRQTVGTTVVHALEAVGQKDEAQRIRSLESRGFHAALVAFLASEGSATLSPQDRKAIELMVANEVADDEPTTLVQMAGALERASIVTDTWRRPETVYPLPAAAARIDGWMQNGPPVPLPPVPSLRTLFIGSATSLAVVRDALLLNVPDSH